MTMGASAGVGAGQHAISRTTRETMCLAHFMIISLLAALAPWLEVCHVETGLLVDRLQQLLADLVLVLLVNLDERLAPHLLLGGRELEYLCPAGLAHRLQRLFVVLARDVVDVARRVLHRASEDGARVRGQAVPERLVHHDGVDDDVVNKAFWDGLPA